MKRTPKIGFYTLNYELACTKIFDFTHWLLHPLHIDRFASLTLTILTPIHWPLRSLHNDVCHIHHPEPPTRIDYVHLGATKGHTEPHFQPHPKHTKKSTPSTSAHWVVHIYIYARAKTGLKLSHERLRHLRSKCPPHEKICTEVIGE